MTVEYSPELLEYMGRKGIKSISVEVASSNHSDFEVTEIYCRYVRESFADYLEEKKGYRSIPTAVGRVLLPPYRLEYAETIRFFVKKTWIFRQLCVDGIKL